MNNYQSLGETLQKEVKKMNHSKDGVVSVDGSDGTQYTEPLRIILVGRSGTGKSATGNSILGQKVFESKLGCQAVTKKCQLETGMLNWRRISVVDTPSIFEPSVWTEEMYKEIVQCYLLSAPGPHALILVTQVGRYTARDKEAMKKVKKIFGVKAMKHLIMLFTHKEDLGESLDDYIVNTENIDLKWGIRECGMRFCAFNNKATGEEQRAQVAELMAVIQRMEKDNEGRYYSNGLYLEAEIIQGNANIHSEESYNYYLQKVKLQIQKETLDLIEAESNCFMWAFCKARKWVSSHHRICLCVLFFTIFLVIIIAICTS